jgi:hypothetical protein
LLLGVEEVCCEQASVAVRVAGREALGVHGQFERGVASEVKRPVELPELSAHGAQP